ncbi:uncharacterized protein RCC_10837 [Ramularia collo-cygni]|uniref:Uncharacterized protein n=1 Tax=Ramularia collo-cygni TaxID=112498 RepID=A0A2D3VRQ9_9PEZI|nr:uncharacterized protein RCC_10837 [Ramularia collo-cygni]CZT25108.1 uncharacterized protein RCC_10837 [Ramularia collo-cygni]
MQFQVIAIALFASLVAAQSGTCFDDGDCFFSGGKCTKADGQITGTCSPKDGTPTTTGGAAPTATGAVCFDDGDCILSGGKCVKTELLGKCSK